MIDNAVTELSVFAGKGSPFLSISLTHPCFDYAAPRVHRHQNPNSSNDPPIIYPGSIERVDFSEEKEDKGYVMILLGVSAAHREFLPSASPPILHAQCRCKSALMIRKQPC